MLGCRSGFLAEKRTESYIGYDEGSIAGENPVMGQEHRGAAGFARWQAGAA